MKVAIRVDASHFIGSGHVMRCKTLADELHRRGAEIRFICRDHPRNLIPLLRNAGHDVSVLPAPPNAEKAESAENYAAWLGVTQDKDADQVIAALTGFHADWLVVDHYGLDARWEGQLRPHVGRILAIDDLANRPHDCDLLLDQNWFGDDTVRRYDRLISGQCRRLLGPRYALLQPAFAQLRPSMPPRDGSIHRALVFFGGVDSHNQTTKALRAFDTSELRDIAVDGVVGHANPYTVEIKSAAGALPAASLHRPLPSLAGLMARTDLMLGTGGSVTWERCCLGLPGIVVTASENQRMLTAALADRGAQLSLGLASETGTDAWREAIRQLKENPSRMRALSSSALNLTDGLGIQRVAIMMEEHPVRLRLRRAERMDEALLLEWANDPDVRRNAFSPDPIHPETHHAWFERKLADSDCMMLIGQDLHGLPIGQVRFDCDGGETLIDVSIDRELRGRGLGEALLRRALEVLRSEGRNEIAVAEVTGANQASLQLFKRLGFQPVPPVRDQTHTHRFMLQGK